MGEAKGQGQGARLITFPDIVRTMFTPCEYLQGSKQLQRENRIA